MTKLFLLFVLVPAVELYLLIAVGARIGPAVTIAIIVLTGIVGATLARAQGLGVLRQIEKEARAGRPPTTSLVDGLLVLIAAVVLLTPGFLTDIAGFLCLLPPTRVVIRGFVIRWARHAFQTGGLRVWTGPGGFSAPQEPPPTGGEGPVIDVTPGSGSGDSAKRAD
jgi:UPF0716 protein FxsA